MAAEPITHEGPGAVELRFTLHSRDYSAALKAWSRTRKGALVLRPWFLVTLAALALALVVLKARDDGLSALLPVYWVLPFLPLLVVVPQRFAAHVSAKANAHHGEITATVDDDGVRYSSAHSDFSGAWSNFGRHLETPDAFLLFSPDKGGNMVYILAKRGLATDADAERLRGLLSAHLAGAAPRA